MRKDVLLFFPRIRKVSTGYRSEGSPPIGLGYLAAVCAANGYSSRIVDFNHERLNVKQVRHLIEDEQPRFVGVSFVTEARYEAFKIFEVAKAVDSRITTVAGGPHPSLTPRDTLIHVPWIDYVVVGEGERTFIALLDSVSKGDISDDMPGIAYRHRGEVRLTENKELIKDLDSVPFPVFSHLSENEYRFFTQYDGYPALKTIPVLTSRGCPFRCNFCATTKIWGSRWRYRSPSNVLEEIQHRIHVYGIEAVWFVDDNFNSHPDRMLEIASRIRQKHHGLKWICNVRIDNLTREHVKAMAQGGCISVEFGAESGSQRILDEVIHKRIRVEKIMEVDHWCQECGIIADAQFIVSHPTETFIEANQTIDLIRRLRGRSTLQVLKIYPGTELEGIARKNNIIKSDFSWALRENRGSPIPSILGDAPLYLENMTLSQVMALMSYAWTDIRGLSIGKIVKAILRKVASPRELWTYLKVGIPTLLKRIKPK